MWATSIGKSRRKIWRTTGVWFWQAKHLQTATWHANTSAHTCDNFLMSDDSYNIFFCYIRKCNCYYARTLWGAHEIRWRCGASTEPLQHGFDFFVATGCYSDRWYSTELRWFWFHKAEIFTDGTGRSKGVGLVYFDSPEAWTCAAKIDNTIWITLGHVNEIRRHSCVPGCQCSHCQAQRFHVGRAHDLCAWGMKFGDGHFGSCSSCRIPCWNFELITVKQSVGARTEKKEKDSKAKRAKATMEFLLCGRISLLSLAVFFQRVYILLFSWETLRNVQKRWTHGDT